MFERNQLHKDFSEEKSVILRQEKYEVYKTKRNLVTSQLRKAKKKYLNTLKKIKNKMLRKHGRELGT